MTNKFKSQAELVRENCGGMEKLESPANFSSNPGWIEKATEAAKGVAKNISDKYEEVKRAYKTGSQETESIGKELAAKQQMIQQAQEALKPTSQQPEQK